MRDLAGAAEAVATKKVDGELWIPRTMWEKRRQLSAVLNRGIMIGAPTLVMSCDDYATFFSRVDMTVDQSREAMSSGILEYMQVAPLLGTADANATDLSRVMGKLGGKLSTSHFDRVILDDVDLILDLRSEEAAVASMFALIYALKARFKQISLFANPLRSDWELEYLAGMKDFLDIHAPAPHQNAA